MKKHFSEPVDITNQVNFGGPGSGPQKGGGSSGRVVGKFKGKSGDLALQYALTIKNDPKSSDLQKQKAITFIKSQQK